MCCSVGTEWKLRALAALVASVWCLQGCSTQPLLWANKWEKLPSTWRYSSPPIKADDLGLHVTKTGSRGYRFHSTIVVVTGHIDELRLDIHDGTLIPIEWVADRASLRGYLYRNDGHYWVWLVTNRLTLRFATESELYLQSEDRRIAFFLPLLSLAYDLDNELLSNDLTSGVEARCVAAEAYVLARNEIDLVNQDFRMRRINDVQKINADVALAPLLSNNNSLCN